MCKILSDLKLRIYKRSVRFHLYVVYTHVLGGTSRSLRLHTRNVILSSHLCSWLSPLSCGKIHVQPLMEI
jgi:hypothetical protein